MLVLSEDPKVDPEPSDPPHSPRPLKKKSRTGAAGKEVIATGSLLTPLLDDVSFPCLSDHTFMFAQEMSTSYCFSIACRLFCSP